VSGKNAQPQVRLDERLAYGGADSIVLIDNGHYVQCKQFPERLPAVEVVTALVTRRGKEDGSAPRERRLPRIRRPGEHARTSLRSLRVRSTCAMVMLSCENRSS